MVPLPGTGVPVRRGPYGRRYPSIRIPTQPFAGIRQKEQTSMSTSSTYTVTGMTCDHCVAAVRQEVGAVDGVTDVQVELATGTLTVESDGPVDPAAVTAAVEEAGYEVAPR